MSCAHGHDEPKRRDRELFASAGRNHVTTEFSHGCVGGWRSCQASNPCFVSMRSWYSQFCGTLFKACVLGVLNGHGLPDFPRSGIEKINGGGCVRAKEDLVSSRLSDFCGHVRLKDRRVIGRKIQALLSQKAERGQNRRDGLTL